MQKNGIKNNQKVDHPKKMTEKKHVIRKITKDDT